MNGCLSLPVILLNEVELIVLQRFPLSDTNSQCVKFRHENLIKILKKAGKNSNL